MRKLLYIFPLSLFAVLLACCGRDAATGRELSRLERIVDEQPDSVLRVLERMEIDTLSPEPLRARHALLTSWAMYKDYLDPASDSIINIAVSHYSRTSDRKNLAKAYFLRGESYIANGNEDDALIDYLRAEDLFEGEDDPFLLGTVCRAICGHLSSIYSTTESLDYSKKAMEAFRKYGDSSYVAYQKLVNSRILFLAGDFNKSRIYADSVIAFAKESSDTVLWTNGLIVLAMVENLSMQNDKAYSHYLELGSLPHRELMDKEKNFMASICVANGDTAAANRMLREAEQTIPAAWRPAEVYAQQGRYREAYETMIALCDSADILLENLVNQKASLIIKEFADGKRIKAESRTRTIGAVSCVAILSLCVIVALIVAVLMKNVSLHRQKERMLMLENENFILKVKNLSEKLETSISNNEKIRTALAKEEKRNSGILPSGYGILNELCKTHNENSIKKSTTKIPNDGVKQIIDSYKIGGTSLLELEQIINNATGNAVKEVRARRISDKDIQVLLLSIVGVTSASIAFISGTDPEKLYNRKSRLKTRLRGLGSESGQVLAAWM